ncbi:putative cardiolipin synthase (CMP-forming), mitochondrial [Iris pallida]|uniref:Cardiolipin synthase (CMP-forming), mitochondrial n=1 Tax=Iris pallida TaxID=29817 RepID=A0AAX6DPG2_IRIPA|nr:putative cardiolipin synthase (CMP-forming), mitochondrial [Iris pallida]
MAGTGLGSTGSGGDGIRTGVPLRRYQTGDEGEGGGERTAEGINGGGFSGKKLQQMGGSATRVLTLPTILTLGRVAAVPLLVSTYHMNGWWATTATTSIFVVAAITDWLDGYIARKMQLGTAFGAFLDPVADKLMVAATLVLLCTKPLKVSMYGEVPWLLTAPSIAIIGREITMSAVREWAASQNGKILEAVAVNSLGKWKTATQMIALTVLVAARDTSLAGYDVLVASGVLLLYISAGLSLWSLVVYMRKIWRILL